LRDLDEAVFQPVLLLLFGERHDFFNIWSGYVKDIEDDVASSLDEDRAV
jgi:hypothetical protein